MLITYANAKVEAYFDDYVLMQRKLGFTWTRKVKKIIEHLKAAETFSDFLSLGLWNPHSLTGAEGVFALSVSSNVRLIIKPDLEKNTLEICEEVEVKGVCDYHGSKTNWYIP